MSLSCTQQHFWCDVSVWRREGDGQLTDWLSRQVRQAGVSLKCSDRAPSSYLSSIILWILFRRSVFLLQIPRRAIITVRGRPACLLHISHTETVEANWCTQIFITFCCFPLTSWTIKKLLWAWTVPKLLCHCNVNFTEKCGKITEKSSPGCNMFSRLPNIHHCCHGASYSLIVCCCLQALWSLHNQIMNHIIARLIPRSNPLFWF